ncbi:hypothetical protein DY000_02053306 [Brassica cretica]|uniref:DUF4283 domain-containing protein n=1 Tax=Brassica cretica TaxID=69181 RepID=A0ABQ7AJ84_BRACR|nr:hypothetical protein DY000_02053306 [Brassica cretica]
MADIKGKGIMYEDDDEPIQIVELEDSHVITEFRLLLMGKILNPKKQNVEKLIQYMINKWGMEDRVTANDLGNGKFIFNFTSEEDIKEVLRQGPFHYNYSMFVLVRWDPIVHDDYPWIQITGLPLHLWNVDNLKRIGGRLGHIDTMELEEGRMLIDIDTRRPLKFTRKVTIGDKEVTIQISYDLLFKHCSTCGMLTHEKEYCPLVKEEPRVQLPSERAGVFARVQVPHGHYDRQPLLRNQSLRDREHDRQVDVLHSRQTAVSRTRENRDRYQGTHVNQYRGLNNSKHDSHSDRIIIARDKRPRSNRYGKGE